MMDSSRIFGNFYKVVEAKNKTIGIERKELSSIFIYDGVIHGTDGYVYVHIPVENWVSKEDGREHLEGRAIHYTVLKEIVKKKYKRIVFTEYYIQAYTSKGDYDEFSYSAIRDKGNKWFLIGGEEFILLEGERITVEIPIYDSIVPDKFEYQTNFVRVNPENLTAIHECFASSRYYEGVQIEFTEPTKSGTPRPAKVTPRGGMHTNSLSEEWAIVMPVS